MRIFAIAAVVLALSLGPASAQDKPAAGPSGRDAALVANLQQQRNHGA
jgi:hypothetical protein